LILLFSFLSKLLTSETVSTDRNSIW